MGDGPSRSFVPLTAFAYVPAGPPMLARASMEGRRHRRYSAALIGIRDRAERAAGWAAHGTVLALGLLLAGPVAVAHRPADHAAQAASDREPPIGRQLAIGPPRDPMAFEQARAPASDDGSTPAAESAAAPAATRGVAVGGLAFAPASGSGGVGARAIYDIFGGSPGLAWALRVARCESQFNPLAVNPQSGATGLFQFMPSTWQAHFAGWNIWDPYAQARAALDFYNRGATNAWTCK